MRLLIQRVSEASVRVEHTITGEIKVGLLLFVGIENEDTEIDIHYLVNKVSSLRIFSDTEGKMNLSIKEVSGAFLVISQFTLHAQTNKGNRPSYIKAAPPEISKPLFDKFISQLKAVSGTDVQAGVFGADMKVSLINDGPVTIWMDSKEK